jgi:hypothetical protein
VQAKHIQHIPIVRNDLRYVHLAERASLNERICRVDRQLLSQIDPSARQAVTERRADRLL